MKWIVDKTGRFHRRPYYTEQELDFECEKVVSDFLHLKYGGVQFPISTADLTLLLERDVADLDLYVDFHGVDSDIEGDTRFFPGQKPKVRIRRELTESTRMENRLRTTLTHEHGHVYFHNALFELDENRRLFPDKKEAPSNQCKREAIISAPKRDWMEWQAGYACGAFLIPATYLKAELAEAVTDLRITGAIPRGSHHARNLVARVAEKFGVSTEAAEVRLLQRGTFAESTGSLFPA
jgi:hypothetical protein